MNALDTKIRDMLEALDEVTPPAPSFDDLQQGQGSNRRSLVLLAAASLLLIGGVAGLVIVNGDEPDSLDRLPATEPDVANPGPSAPTTPTASTVATVAATTVDLPPSTFVEPDQALGGSPLNTPIDRTTVPYIALGDWTVTYAVSDVSTQQQGMFGRAVAYIGPGPTYDAPLVSAYLVDEDPPPVSDAPPGTDPPPTGEVMDSLFTSIGATSGGDETVEAFVNGVRSVAIVQQQDSDTKLDGPIVTLYVPNGPTRYVVINAVRIELDAIVSLAETIDVDGEVLIEAPVGFVEMSPFPTSPQEIYLEYQYSDGERSFQISANNRGIEGLLGRIGGEVRTTREVAGAEVAYRPLPDSPGRYWADWLAGDWSFYVDAEGFESEESFFQALAELRYTDADTLSQLSDGGITAPSQRDGTIAAMIADVPLPPGFDVDALAAWPGVNDRYQEIARVSGAVACGWLDVWFEAQESGDADAAGRAAGALATSMEWSMLLEIESQGGWSQAVWEFAGAVNGDNGIITGGGEMVPERDMAESGLGCDLA